MCFLHRCLALCAVAAAFAGLAQASDGNGLTLDSEALSWPRLQGRWSVGTPLALPRAPASRAPSAAASPVNLSLLGDYYLTGSLLGPKRAGGFRATSGIIVAARSPSLVSSGPSTSPLGFATDRRPLDAASSPGAESEFGAMPYLGLGYTGLSSRGGWSFSADLGLVSQTRNGAVKLGRAISGSQSLDDAVRDMRLAPLLQLGVSYSF